MNATQAQTGYQPVHQEEVTMRTIAGGALMESNGAVAALALAIAGLAGAYSTTLAAIATIVLGAAVWIEGGELLTIHRARAYQENASPRTLEWSQGLGAEFLGGLSGIVLGVLALLGVASIPLLSIATLVLGATFLFGSRTGVSSVSQRMFGLAGVILGLLAVCGLYPITLVLVSFLCLGASALFNGAATGTRMTFAGK